MTGLPILMLHSVDDSGSPISLSLFELERMLRDLADAGWHGRSLMAAAARAQAQPGEKCFAITFDDGYANVLTEALPVLREFGCTATVFVIAGRSGGDNRWPGQAAWVPPMPLLDWPGMETLARAGWEIGSHGMDHRPLPACTPDEVERSVAGAADAIVTNLGTKATSFAYPLGAQSALVRSVVGRYHDLAVTTRLAVAAGADLRCRLALPRIDTYYLRRYSAVTALQSHRGRAYLATRRWLRGLRAAAGAVAGRSPAHLYSQP